MPLGTSREGMRIAAKWVQLATVWIALLALLFHVEGAMDDDHHRAWNPRIHPPSHFYVDGERPPGTLILAMVVKNEAETLNKTLPKWKQVIDHYVIGVDDHNEDDTLQVIAERLKGIQGEAMTITFDGMGPTYTQVLRRGWELFPKATHGIMADADYAPVNTDFDKYSLNIHASQQTFKLHSDWSQRRTHYRMMDWIYRNSPDVRVERRTHQTLSAPPLAGSNDTKSILPSGLIVEETGPGYQDRTFSVSGKFFRYYEMLLKDLDDYPDDPRTLYYLGDSCMGAYMWKQAEGKGSAEDEWLLNAAHDFFQRRIHVKGYFEEAYFAFNYLGKINREFWKNYEDALYYYKQAYKLDPHRVDALEHIARLYIDQGKYEAALIPLAKAVELPIPERTYLQHIGMYECRIKVMYAETVANCLQRGKLSESYLEFLIEDVLERLQDVPKKCTIHRDFVSHTNGITARAKLRRYLQQVQKRGYY